MKTCFVNRESVTSKLRLCLNRFWLLQSDNFLFIFTHINPKIKISLFWWPKLCLSNQIFVSDFYFDLKTMFKYFTVVLWVIILKQGIPDWFDKYKNIKCSIHFFFFFVNTFYNTTTTILIKYFYFYFRN